jgi:hypothetical protein
VGSIPIARSTLKATPGHVGLQDWGQDIDPMGKSWEIRVRDLGVGGRLVTLTHTVVAQHGGNSQSVIRKDMVTSRRLDGAMRLKGTPCFHRLLVSSERQREQFARRS